MPLTANVLQNRKMIDRCSRYVIAFLSLGLPFWCADLACAALGSDAASVLADAEELRGTVQSTSLPLYDIHEITSDGAMRVREFLTREGTVFAVTWEGPVVPDLKSLLGASFASFVEAAAKQPGTQRSLRVTLPELVVESAGHMRAYRGRAYLPLLVPPGASAADLR
jgi:hypothetical protein